MSDPNDLAAFLAEAWQHLEDGVADSRAPARYPTFATTGPDGTPQARTVALRGADRDDARLEVHTDLQTDKVTALTQTPLAAVHIWLPQMDLQIRATAEVLIRTGQEVAHAWARVPQTSRVSYGTLPAPGTPIDHVFAYDKPTDESRFAVLDCQLTHLDLVHLGQQHRRAQYTGANGWQGTWVAP